MAKINVFYGVLFGLLFFACEPSRDFTIAFVQHLDKKELKITGSKKSRQKRPRGNMHWEEEGIHLGHFFDFKNDQLIFYNQRAGYLSWRGRDLRGEISAPWIREVFWVACFDKRNFVLQINKKALSLYSKPFFASKFLLLTTTPLETSSRELKEKKVLNRRLDLRHPQVVLEAQFEKNSIEYLFSDYRLVVFSGEGFKKVEWLELPKEMLKGPIDNLPKKSQEYQTYFYQIFLTETPGHIYITFKQYSPQGLEAILVHYVDVKNKVVKQTRSLKISGRSFIAIENHRFITATFIKAKDKYNFYYKHLRQEESFIRSIHLPGLLSPYQLKVKDEAVIGYYIQGDTIEFFQWN